MVKYYCDKCKREFNRSLLYEVELGTLPFLSSEQRSPRKWLLCVGCQNKLKLYMTMDDEEYIEKIRHEKSVKGQV